MTFWIIIVFMTLAASLAVLRPLVSSRKASEPVASHDIEVYRDQMAELERDRERGLISEEDAGEARAEIGRRLLKADEENQDPRQGSAGMLTKLAATVAVLSIPVVSWAFYAGLGSPDMPSQPLVARLSKPPQQSSVAELIARAETHLQRNPQDGDGWEVLAPIYMRTGRFQESVDAWRKVIAIKGESAQRLTGLGEALGAAAGGNVDDKSLAAFQAALKLDPKDEKARFFLGVADAQSGKLDEARARWKDIADSAAENSPWKTASLNAIEQANRNEQQAKAAPAAPGPTAGDIAAAKDMTAGDRQAMIEGMVERLAGKLKDDPSDADGWQRLIRAYAVLGRKEDAAGALATARDALKAAPEKLAALEQFAAGLGLETAKEGN